MAGAPIGNQNAVKSRPWALAIERALARRSKVAQMEALDALAEKLLDRCDQGDMVALKELGDRLDGKPKQQIDAEINGQIALAKIKTGVPDGD